MTRGGRGPDREGANPPIEPNSMYDPGREIYGQLNAKAKRPTARLKQPSADDAAPAGLSPPQTAGGGKMPEGWKKHSSNWQPLDAAARRRFPHCPPTPGLHKSARVYAGTCGT